jgi:hypothetical protein
MRVLRIGERRLKDIVALLLKRIGLLVAGKLLDIDERLSEPLAYAIANRIGVEDLLMLVLDGEDIRELAEPFADLRLSLSLGRGNLRRGASVARRNVGDTDGPATE